MPLAERLRPGDTVADVESNRTDGGEIAEADARRKVWHGETNLADVAREVARVHEDHAEERRVHGKGKAHLHRGFPQREPAERADAPWRQRLPFEESLAPAIEPRGYEEADGPVRAHAAVR